VAAIAAIFGGVVAFIAFWFAFLFVGLAFKQAVLVYLGIGFSTTLLTVLLFGLRSLVCKAPAPRAGTEIEEKATIRI